MAASKSRLGKAAMGIAILGLLLGIAAIIGLRAEVLPTGHHGLGSFGYLFAVLGLDALALLLGVAGLILDEEPTLSLVGMVLSLLPALLGALALVIR